MPQAPLHGTPQSATRTATRRIAMTDLQYARATARITADVEMPNTYPGGPQIAPLIAAMEALAQAPGDVARRSAVEGAFAGLGIRQGAVLTCAPYLAELFASNLFGKDD